MDSYFKMLLICTRGEEVVSSEMAQYTVHSHTSRQALILTHTTKHTQSRELKAVCIKIYTLTYPKPYIQITSTS